jgi:fructose-1,6-bisphosphatase/inositol monophosphatase family enzyme
MHLPALGETYWARKGGGAFLNGDPVHVSKTPRVEKVLGSAFGFVEKPGTPLLKLMGAWEYAYGFMDAYTYGSIAAGRIDASVNLLDKPWDCAAAACIVMEAGGRFSDLKGVNTVYSGSCVLSNGIVHEAVLEYFQ